MANAYMMGQGEDGGASGSRAKIMPLSTDFPRLNDGRIDVQFRHADFEDGKFYLVHVHFKFLSGGKDWEVWLYSPIAKSQPTSLDYGRNTFFYVPNTLGVAVGSSTASIGNSTTTYLDLRLYYESDISTGFQLLDLYAREI